MNLTNTYVGFGRSQKHYIPFFEALPIYVVSPRCIWAAMHGGFSGWTPYHRIPMSYLCKAYELVGGVFSQTSDHVLQTVQLPTRKQAAYTTSELAFAFVVRDFAIDPTQDVIALHEDDDTFVQCPGSSFSAIPTILP